MRQHNGNENAKQLNKNVCCRRVNTRRIGCTACSMFISSTELEIAVRWRRLVGQSSAPEHVVTWGGHSIQASAHTHASSPFGHAPYTQTPVLCEARKHTWGHAERPYSRPPPPADSLHVDCDQSSTSLERRRRRRRRRTTRAPRSRSCQQQRRGDHCLVPAEQYLPVAVTIHRRLQRHGTSKQQQLVTTSPSASCVWSLTIGHWQCVICSDLRSGSRSNRDPVTWPGGASGWIGCKITTF